MIPVVLIKDENLSKKLSKDVDEMEKMLNEYLQYASTGAKDKTESFNLSKLLDETIDNYDNENIQKKFEKKLFFNGRKNLIRRCINNLIDNSISL